MSMVAVEDAELARRMIEHLRAQGVVTDEQLGVAATHYEAGQLPSTSLRRAGVDKNAVLRALSAAAGLPAAPPYERWSVQAPGGGAWPRAWAVPIGVDGDRLVVAVADPKRMVAGAGALPPHRAVCCLEEDLERGLHALAMAGATVLDANMPTMSTTPAGQKVAPPIGSGRVQALAPEQVGPWIVDDMLAQGGMGVVYRAHDHAGRAAALKLVHGHLVNVPEVRARFVREARATQRLHHKNVVAVLDVGETEPAYLAVEFVDGGDVLALAARVRPLPVAAALEVLVQVLEGLTAAHAQGIVHRDLKPANLLLTKEGVVKIADFGIARELDATALTQTGSTVGTPAYMSPEQALAEGIDVRSDLYSAGVIAYELLAGRKPFEGESLGAVITAILRGRAAPLFEVNAAVPEAVEELVIALMQPDREARPASAADACKTARALFDTARGRRASPIRELLADPDGAATAMRREEADAYVARAKSLLPVAARREAAALALFRALAASPGHDVATQLLAGLTPEGFRFGPPPMKLAELDRELKKSPDDPVLLQRAAQTARQDGNVYLATVYWRRSLRIRPDDAHAASQLSRMTGVDVSATVALPAAASSPSTVQRIAGHIPTGGFRAAAPVPVSAAPASSSSSSSASSSARIGRNGLPLGPEVDVAAEPIDSQVRASFSLHKSKLFALVAAVVVVMVIVKGGGKIIQGLKREVSEAGHATTDKAPSGQDDDEASGVDVDKAQEELAAGNTAETEKHATAAIERGARHSVMARAYLARGDARMQQGKALAAVADYTHVIDGYRNDDVAYPAALLHRGIAEARTGDASAAKADLSACIDSKATQPQQAEAKLERGKLRAAAGDVEGARADFTWAHDYMPPQSPVAQSARDELQRLGP